jgi:hypothetical protein
VRNVSPLSHSPLRFTPQTGTTSNSGIRLSQNHLRDASPMRTSATVAGGGGGGGGSGGGGASSAAA